ncbi:DUF3078 domain-containing protein [Chryseobacterium lacus]|uniref:DUF3078 domain-containing protein n=1 Tax=Chryseobacterium lacus TaxID=2058346 RepID=A0A368N0A2_9FLAO|nr:DUF3078 domain-containing protein [Chryseobacterium lacus]RCU43513.1 DUF3078 domain-containing protein [Chryseobacterium lacus]RST28524.1 DUF3078 domain-containing protein [Chryseobacterium lacus]
MMKRIFLVLFSVVSVHIFSQDEKTNREILDSINHQRWKAVSLNLDSLAKPAIEDVPTKFQDTIFLPPTIQLPEPSQELPITPFSLNHFKESKKWYFHGQNNVVFNQASFSNWYSGGINNIGVLGKINYNLSYRNKKHFLENILELKYGWIASEGQASRKTEDYINLALNYGYDVGKNFYISSGFKFVSQFAPGFNYTETPEPSYYDRISNFLAPGYLNAGVGLSYNPNENFQVIFRPVNGKFTFVMDPMLQKAGKYGLERDGQSFRQELGAMMNVIYRWKIYKDIILDNQVNLFSNYVEHAERVDIAYKGALTLRFNKFISTLVTLDLSYDHDQIRALQRKQTLGIGFSYNLGVKHEAEIKKKAIKPYVAP